MASIKKSGGKWRAQINPKGERDSGSFDTRAQAFAWAADTTKSIIAGKRGGILDKAFADLLEKYRDEVSVTKKGERWERVRIGLLCRDEIAKVGLRNLGADDFAAWRDRRLKCASTASVRRKWTLLSHTLTIEVQE